MNFTKLQKSIGFLISEGIEVNRFAKIRSILEAKFDNDPRFSDPFESLKVHASILFCHAKFYGYYKSCMYMGFQQKFHSMKLLPRF